MASLAGGQAARAGLASLLLSRYDVFLLDEPTNDLDLDGLARLERFVSGLRAATAQAAPAGLAWLLLSRYDVFLLDEPTNDLDLDHLARLERFVSGLRAATVL